jgi:hypothetical protein
MLVVYKDVTPILLCVSSLGRGCVLLRGRLRLDYRTHLHCVRPLAERQHHCHVRECPHPPSPVQVRRRKTHYFCFCAGMFVINFIFLLFVVACARYWDLVQTHKVTQFYTAPTASKSYTKNRSLPICLVRIALYLQK